MRIAKVKLVLDEYEQGILIKALNELRNAQIQKGLSTDAIDEVLIRTVYAPKKSAKVSVLDEQR